MSCIRNERKRRVWAQFDDASVAPWLLYSYGKTKLFHRCVEYNDVSSKFPTVTGDYDDSDDSHTLAGDLFFFWNV